MSTTFNNKLHLTNSISPYYTNSSHSILPIVIIIDAEIGAGKTTLLNILKQNLKMSDVIFKYIDEPVEKWKADGILQAFYNDMKAFAYKFQTYTFITRVQKCIDCFNETMKEQEEIILTLSKDTGSAFIPYIKSQQPRVVYICERSIYSDRYIFVEMLYKDNLLTDLEYHMYKQWWDLWEKIMPFKPTAFVRLSVNIDKCIDRIKIRNRENESTISREYLVNLHDQHDKFFNDISKQYITTTINGNIDFLNNTDNIKSIINDFNVLINEQLSINDKKN